MKPREPYLEIPGPFAIHDMACAVVKGESAVYYLNDGVFHPSWEAQKKGWHLVHAKTRLQKWAIKFLFKEGQQ